jgi:hypothetical protein
MLISKSKIAVGDIATFKLINGDEMVAKIVNKSLEGDYVINRPLMVAASQQGVGLLPGLFTAEENENIELKAQHIMMCAPTVEQIVAHYTKMTTGIEVLPKEKIIV